MPAAGRDLFLWREQTDVYIRFVRFLPWRVASHFCTTPWYYNIEKKKSTLIARVSGMSGFTIWSCNSARRNLRFLHGMREQIAPNRAVLPGSACCRPGWSPFFLSEPFSALKALCPCHRAYLHVCRRLWTIVESCWMADVVELRSAILH
jgi:hypothetical protein